MRWRSQDLVLRLPRGAAEHGRLPVLIAGAALGICAGLAAAGLPASATLAVMATLALAVSLVGVWKLLRAGVGTAWTPVVVAGASAGRSERARSVTRWMAPETLLFLLGTATVAEITWKAGSRLALTDVCFLASFLCCSVWVLRGHSVQRIPPLLAVGGCLFAIGGLVSAIGSVALGRSLYETARGTWVLFLWPWTAVSALRDRRSVLIALSLWTLTGGLDGLAALGQTTGISTIAGPLEGNRATGFGGHPNDLGAACCTVLVPALALALKAPAASVPRRWLQWICVALVGTGLALSGSVSAMVGGLIGLFLWMVAPNVRRSIRVLILLGLAGGLLATSILGGPGTSPAHRVQQVFAPPSASGTTGSARDHAHNVGDAWRLIRQDPIVGIGVDNTSTIVHSGLIAAWLGGGIFALVGMLLVFAATLSFGWWAAISARDDADRAIAWALVCGVVAFFAFFVNQPLFFNEYGFIALALVAAWSVRVSPVKAAVVEPTRRLAIAEP